MRFQTFNQWAGSVAVNTEPRVGGEEYVGIAIGPQSDEWQVNIDGVVLQAGRMLPIRSRTYALQKIRPVPVAGDTIGSLAYGAAAKLQVVLFETYDEMASYKTPARPPCVYSSPRAVANLTTYAAFFGVPFGGRTGAVLQFCSDDEGANTFALEVIGIRYNQANANLSSGANPAYTYAALLVIASTQVAFGTQAVYTVVLGPGGSIAAPFGAPAVLTGSPPGAWDAIGVLAAGSVAGMHLQVDATVYGEL